MKLSKFAPLLLLVAVIVTISCSSDSSGLKITRDEYGESWPLTVSEGYLDCRGLNEIVFTVQNGKTYAVNGSAKSNKEYADIIEIWKVDSSYNDPAIRKDISPLIERGLELCKKSTLSFIN